MGEYLRSLTLYLAMIVMVFTIAGFTTYFSNVGSMKQDTYKEFMYTAMNKSTLRLVGVEGLYDGDFNTYYSTEELDYEIVKNLGLTSKVDTSIDYEFIYNTSTNEYYLHIESDEVDTVLKFKLEKGEV